MVPFYYAGIVKEFPTAPKDSFFVANAAYVAVRTGSPAIGEYPVSTNGTPPPVVARRLRAALGPIAAVTDILTTRQVIASTLTAVDLSGVTRVELAFALALAVSATGLLLTLGFAERRRTFALARVLGAHPRQLGGFVWAEVIFTGLIGSHLRRGHWLAAVRDAGQGTHRGLRPASRPPLRPVGLPGSRRRPRRGRPGHRRRRRDPRRPPPAAHPSCATSSLDR
jgi:putative ABC transport system permease protein